MNFIKTASIIGIMCGALAAPAFSATFDCRIAAKKTVTHYSGVTPTRLRVTIGSNGAVRVSDNVGRKAGRSTVEGNLGRRVGNAQLFSWQLSPVPRSMLPPTETKFYEPTVNYRARLDTRTGKISLRGSFVTSVSSANSGLNMQGFGSCRRV